MNVIHLMVGIQGSGKSTFSKKLAIEQNMAIVSTDLVRMENPGMKEELVWPTVYQKCADELSKGKDLIFDATSITPKVRLRLKENVEKLFTPFDMGCYFFNVHPEVCKERVNKRNQLEEELFFPIEVIDSYFERLVPPTLEEGFIFVKEVDEMGHIVKEIQQAKKEKVGYGNK